MSPLPRPVRNAAVGALLLAALVGFGSAQEVSVLFRLSEATQEAQKAQAEIIKSLGEPELIEKVLGAQLSALEGLRDSRLLILLGLSTFCALGFVAALRLLRPGGLQREGVRSLLSRAALAAAALRTLDGAQLASVMRKAAGAAVEQLSASSPESRPWELVSLAVGASIGLTALMAGGFAAVAIYFRSEKVKQIVALADRG